MADFRGTARGASRFTGDQFGNGFQYRNSELFALKLGPWDRMSTSGEPGTLDWLLDCYIKDGAVMGIGEYEATTVTTYNVLGANELPIAFVNNHILFRRNTTTGFVEILTDDGTGAVSTASTIVAGTSNNEIAFEVWGGYVYFGSRALTGGMYRYEKATVTFSAAIAGAPANIDFLFQLNNNLVAVHKTANLWTIQWSVDGLPEDWTGVGSGSILFPSTFGEVKSVVKLGDTIFIIGQRGSLRMSATGTLPAFRFDNIYELYTNNYKGATSHQNLIYFISPDLQMRIFDGNSVSDVGDKVTLTSTTARVFSLKRVDFVVCTDSDYYQICMIYRQGKLVGLLDTWGTTISAMADFPPTASAPRGNILIYSEVAGAPTSYRREVYALTVGSTDFYGGSFETPVIDLGENISLEYIEVQFITVNPNFRQNITYSLRTDLNTTLTTGTTAIPVIYGTTARVTINQVARFIVLGFADFGEWEAAQGTLHITIIGRRQKKNTPTAIRG